MNERRFGAGALFSYGQGSFVALARYLILLAFAEILLWAPQSSAATYHVRADTGSDTNSGTSLAAAFKTIQKGADLALPGDTVRVYTGVYRERVKPPRGGTGEDARITYMANPGDTVVITALDLWSPGWTPSGNLFYATPPDSMFTDTNYVDGGNPFKIAYGNGINGAASLGQVVVDGIEYAEKTSQTEANSVAQSWYVNRSSGRGEGALLKLLN